MAVFDPALRPVRHRGLSGPCEHGVADSACDWGGLRRMTRTGRLLRGLGLGLALAGLSACVETPPPAPAVPLRAVPVPDSFIRLAVDFGTAGFIADQCEGEFALSAEAFVNAITRFAQSNPQFAQYSEAEWQAAANSRAVKLRVQDAAFAYVAKRRILIEDAASWCAAGRFETVNKTAIGAYLVEK